MIPIEYYVTFYHLTLTVAVLMMVIVLLKNGDSGNFSEMHNIWYCSIILLITVLFIGLRDPWASSKYLGDTGTYSRFYLSDIFKNEKINDMGFTYFAYFCSKFLKVDTFYLLCAVIYVGLPYLSFQKWFQSRAWLALLVYVTAMSFWAFGANGLRNGLAASFFIFGISFIKKPLYMGIWFLLAISFHKSMALPVVAFLLTYLVKDTRMLLWFWLAAIPIAFFFGNNMESSLNEFFKLINFSDSRIDNLYVDELEGQAISRSFRLDFILYSSVAVFLGYYYIVKKGFNDLFYIHLFNTYLIANTIWILMIYAAYTNRTAYLSWFLMPVVMVYPLLKVRMHDKQENWIAWMILGSLTFTLFMHFK